MTIRVKETTSPDGTKRAELVGDFTGSVEVYYIASAKVWVRKTRPENKQGTRRTFYMTYEDALEAAMKWANARRKK